MKSCLSKITSWLGINIVCFLSLSTSVLAQVHIDTEHAQEKATSIEISPGRATAIEFRNKEKISSVFLSDVSRLVYNSNAPFESGKAQTLFLNQIQPLSIDGITHSNIPNLFITTVDPKGDQREYEFLIHFTTKAHSHTHITIIPAQHNSWENTIDTARGKATVPDIERGLDIAIASGKLSKNHPIVSAIHQCLVLAYNNTPITEAAKSYQVSLNLLQELGTIGLEVFHQKEK